MIREEEKGKQGQDLVFDSAKKLVSLMLLHEEPPMERRVGRNVVLIPIGKRLEAEKKVVRRWGITSSFGLFGGGPKEEKMLVSLPPFQRG